MSIVDVIFCRNVFIYFNREQQERALDVFWGSLARGGYLVLGRSERLAPTAAKRFELVNGRETDLPQAEEATVIAVHGGRGVYGLRRSREDG